MCTNSIKGKRKAIKSAVHCIYAASLGLILEMLLVKVNSEQRELMVTIEVQRQRTCKLTFKRSWVHSSASLVKRSSAGKGCIRSLNPCGKAARQDQSRWTRGVIWYKAASCVVLRRATCLVYRSQLSSPAFPIKKVLWWKIWKTFVLRTCRGAVSSDQDRPVVQFSWRQLRLLNLGNTKGTVDFSKTLSCVFVVKMNSLQGSTFCMVDDLVVKLYHGSQCGVVIRLLE